MDAPKYSNLDKPLSQIDGIYRVFSKKQLTNLKNKDIVTIGDFIKLSNYCVDIKSNYDDIYDFLLQKVLCKMGLNKLIILYDILKQESSWILLLSEKTKKSLLKTYKVNVAFRELKNIKSSRSEFINDIWAKRECGCSLQFTKEPSIIYEPVLDDLQIGVEYSVRKVTGKELLINQQDVQILELLKKCNLDDKDLKSFNDDIYEQTQGKEDLFWYISEHSKFGYASLLKILFMLYQNGVILEKLCKYSNLLLNKNHISRVYKSTIYSYKKFIDMDEFTKIYGIIC